MRHIIKGHEPELFSGWKQDNDGRDVVWEDLASDAKRALREALLAEQGHICCYCGMRIRVTDEENEVHSAEDDDGQKKKDERPIIEHLKPRSAFPELTFEYQNLLASCSGGQAAHPPRAIHCDKKKGNWYEEGLMVSPLNPDCEDYFVYRPNGTIEPTKHPGKNPAARETMDRLGLDIPKLNARRASALAPIIDALDLSSDEERQALIEGYSRPGREGRLAPFCFALVQVLKRYV